MQIFRLSETFAFAGNGDELVNVENLERQEFVGDVVKR